VVGVHRRLSNLVGSSFAEERVRPATFPLPKADEFSDAASAHLLWQAARLTLREAPLLAERLTRSEKPGGQIVWPDPDRDRPTATTEAVKSPGGIFTESGYSTLAKSSCL
jgi:hypothetical protein